MDISIKKELKNDNMIITPSTNRRLCMKTWKRIAVVSTIVVGGFVFNACTKPETKCKDDEEWNGCECVKKQIPIVKKDTIVGFDAHSIPTQQQLQEIKNIPNIGNVDLRIDNIDFRIPGAELRLIANNLIALKQGRYFRNIIPCTVLVRSAIMEVDDIVELWKQLGVTFTDDESILTSSKSAKSIVKSNGNGKIKQDEYMAYRTARKAQRTRPPEFVIRRL